MFAEYPSPLHRPAFLDLLPGHTPTHNHLPCLAPLEPLGSVFVEVEGCRASIGVCHCDAISNKQGLPGRQGNGAFAVPKAEASVPSSVPRRVVVFQGRGGGGAEFGISELRWLRSSGIPELTWLRLSGEEAGIAGGTHLQVSVMGRLPGEPSIGQPRTAGQGTLELSRPTRPSGLCLCHLPILGGSPVAAALCGQGAFRHPGGQQGHFSSGESQRRASRPVLRVSRCVTKPGSKSRNSFMNMLITLSGLPPTICLNLNIIYLMDCTDMCQSK